MNRLKKLIIFVLILTLILPTTVVEAKGTKSVLNMDLKTKQFRYVDYLKEFNVIARADNEIIIPAKEAELSQDSYLGEYDGRSDVAIWKNGGSGKISFSVDIQESQFYHISIVYNAYDGYNSIERLLRIDGKELFNEVNVLSFQRAWGTISDELNYDNMGNAIKPRMNNKPLWQEHIVGEASGRLIDPFLIYFEKGHHTITLEGVRESIAIESLRLFGDSTQASYQAPDNSDIKPVQPVKIQGEDVTLRSASVLSPMIDRSNISTEPYNMKVDRFNYIGGYNWRDNGQWLEWKTDIPESGYYRMSIRYRQNYIMGTPAMRTLFVDGKIPFDLAKTLEFPYGQGWQMYDFAKDQKPYWIYLEKGVHTFKLQSHLEQYVVPIEEVRGALDRLLAIYSNIIMITGAIPDNFRDYQLEKRIPGLQDALAEISSALIEQEAEIKIITNGDVGNAHLLKRIAQSLLKLSKKPQTIPQSLQYLIDNMAELSNWIQTSSELPMDIDYIYFYGKDDKVPKLNPSFLNKFTSWFERFFLSFTKDYSSVGNVYKKEDSLDLWVVMGREQVDILKVIIDDTFTPKTGIPVNVNILSTENTLLFSVASGKAPDVVMQVSSTIPVDYGLRNALLDLSEMPNYDEVASRFKTSAIEPYAYGESVYGIPTTQSFPIMFYRKDILERVNAKVPKTWDEFYKTVAILNQSNLQVVTDGVFDTLLYQNNGSYFDESQTKCTLDSPNGLKSFKSYTDLYTKYGLPIYYSLYNRFRSGDIPIGITDLSFYNQLSVAAPEIKNLWGMELVPGTVQPDGSINRTVIGGGNANVILKDTDKKEQAWEFLDWWTSTPIQTRYAQDVEARMGVGARVATANVDAMKNMAWSAEEQKILLKQWEEVRGIPNIPGSYYAGRHLQNAFREVIEYKRIPRDTLVRYTDEINIEIDKKMTELGVNQKP